MIKFLKMFSISSLLLIFIIFLYEKMMKISNKLEILNTFKNFIIRWSALLMNFVQWKICCVIRTKITSNFPLNFSTLKFSYFVKDLPSNIHAPAILAFTFTRTTTSGFFKSTENRLGILIMTQKNKERFYFSP